MNVYFSAQKVVHQCSVCIDVIHLFDGDCSGKLRVFLCVDVMFLCLKRECYAFKDGMLAFVKGILLDVSVFIEGTLFVK